MPSSDHEVMLDIGTSPAIPLAGVGGGVGSGALAVWFSREQPGHADVLTLFMSCGLIGGYLFCVKGVVGSASTFIHHERRLQLSNKDRTEVIARQYVLR